MESIGRWCEGKLGKEKGKIREKDHRYKRDAITNSKRTEGEEGEDIVRITPRCDHLKTQYDEANVEEHSIHGPIKCSLEH